MLLFKNVAQRRRQPELMDQPGLEERRHRAALRGLERVNFFSRSPAIVWPALQRLAADHDGTLRVLDVACGAGDVPLGIERLARSHAFDVSIAACDVSPVALRYARERAERRGSRIEFLQIDVLAESLPECDVAMCSLFLHHLEEEDAVRVLQKMAAAARRGVIVNDLARTSLGYALAYCGVRILSRSAVVHVDGPLSVQGAFTCDEALRLAEQAGLRGATIARRWPERFLLTWSRP